MRATIVPMPRRGNFFLIFLFFLSLSIATFLFFGSSVGVFISGLLEGSTNSIRSTSLSVYAATKGDSEIEKLKKQILSLQSQLAATKEQQKEINALRDQFATTNPESSRLLPAQIVGMKSYLPGYSLPEQFILDKGSNDGIKKGSVVIYKDILIGQIVDVKAHLSLVDLTFSKGFSITAVTSKTNALGVVKGKGSGELIIDNVVLSDELKKDDIVMTKGSVDTDGTGALPDLQIGKIISIEKKPSSLFQTAKLSLLLDVPRLTRVFVYR